MHTCVLAVKDTSVVVIFFVSVNFYFSMFLGMVITANEFETKEI